MMSSSKNLISFKHAYNRLRVGFQNTKFSKAELSNAGLSKVEFPTAFPESDVRPTFSYYLILIFLFSAGILSALRPAYGQTEQFANDLNELHQAISKAQPGDVIIMRDGVWMDANILFEADGMEGDSITLTVETPGKVILSGNSRLRIAGNYLKVDGLVFRDGYLTNNGGHVIQFRKDSSKWAHHSRVTNTAIIDYNPPDWRHESRWVSLFGTHNRVDHCLFKNKTNDANTLVIWMHEDPNYHRVDHNYFLDRPDIDSGGAETIRIGTSGWSLHDSRTIVEHNLFERCNGEGEIISNKSGGNTYRYNTFLESEGALTLRHGHRATINGNFFIGNNKERTGGIRVYGDDHLIYNNYFEGLEGSGSRSTITLGNGVEDPPLHNYSQVRRAIIAFNTFYDNNTTIEIGFGKGRTWEYEDSILIQNLPPKDVVMANNLVFTSRSPIIHDTDEPINMTWEGNIMYTPTIEDYPSNLGIEQPEGIHLVDPEFEISEDGLYSPAASSPAIESAEGDYPFVTDDIHGRPRGENKDIGAHQLSGEPKIHGRLTPEDVGPLWFTSSCYEIPLLDKAKLLQPAEGSLEPVQPEFEWEEVDFASGHQFQITMTNFLEDSILLDTVVTEARLTLPFELETSERHRWRVRTLADVEKLEEYSACPWEVQERGPWSDESTFRTRSTTTVESHESIPSQFSLFQNYPNPFNPATYIKYGLPESAHVTIRVYDVTGRQVEILLDEEQQAGYHRLYYDTESLPSGVYQYQLKALPATGLEYDRFVQTRSMTLIK